MEVWRSSLLLMRPLTQALRKEISALHRRRERYALGRSVVEGVRSVEAAVLAGVEIEALVVTPGAAPEARVAALLAFGAAVYEASAADLARLSDVETSQGVLAVVRLPDTAPGALAGHRSVLVLDGLQDPGNVGTVLRTAAWFGVEAVACGPGTADPFAPKTIRASMGGVWDVRVALVPDVAASLDALAAAGHAIYGAALSGTPLTRWTPAVPSALVLGSEAHGLSEAAAARLTEAVTIPGAAGRRGVESLNVGVAAGILVSRWRG